MRTGDQVVQSLPWRWRAQGTIFVIGGLGFLFDAWDVTLNAFLIPLVSAEWGLSLGERGWVGTANLIGMAVGAFAWGAVADTIGRKKAFSLTILMFSVFTVLGAASPDFVTFCAFRFLAGVGLGGCIPVDFALVGEFTPAKVRGRVLAAMDGFWPLGATLCGLTAAFLAGLGSWRLLMLTMVLPALMLFWIRRGVPESPMFLVAKGRPAEAKKVIDDLVARTGAPREEWTLPEPQQAQRLSPKVMFAQLKDIWRFDPRRTGAMWLMFLAVFLLYYGAITWLPSILKAQGYGTYAAFMVTTGTVAVGIVSALISAWLVDVFGRKWVIAVTAPLASVALVMFAVQINVDTAAKVWITLYGALIQIAIPALYAFAPELYPTHLRASGFGWASTISRIGAGFVPVLLGSLLWPRLGLPLTFAVIGVVVVGGVIVMMIAAPETKMQPLAEAVPS